MLEILKEFALALAKEIAQELIKRKLRGKDKKK